MPAYTITELETQEEFDPSILAPMVPFTQASFYGDWQRKLGRRVRRFVVRDHDTAVAYFQCISYPLILGKRYLYLPYGPVLGSQDVSLLTFLKEVLTALAHEEHAVFVRLDCTPVCIDAVLSPLFSKAPAYTYHSAYFQPRLEWYLPLQKSEEELYAGIHEKNRYSIRLAERKGVTVQIITQDFETHFNVFMDLMDQTAKRNGFSLHPRAYYAEVFARLKDIPSYLAIATYNGVVVVVDVVVMFGSVANHIYGASSNEHRTIAPSGLTQWKSIVHAKQSGCAYYNFGGISSGDLYKGWEGLTRFKKRFGGIEVAHADFYDLVVHPLIYRLYNLRKLVRSLW